MQDRSSSRPNPKVHLENVIGAIQVLFEPEQVVELRIPKAGRCGTISGYFNDFRKLAKLLVEFSGDVDAVYYTLNPVSPSLLARANNRIEEHASATTSDSPDNIIQRRWLLVDCDPVRPSGISSTDEEKKAAGRLATDIRDYLTGIGWPKPVAADSGNGYHLLYRIDLPNDDASRALVESVLKALAARFDNDKVKVDQKVFNAARITKAYGTMACKGDSTMERPHRISKMFKPPESIETVGIDMLKELALELPKREKTSGAAATTAPGGWTPQLLEEVLDKAEVNRGKAQEYKGGLKWQHDCLRDSSHTKPDAFTILKDGYVHHYCAHDSCKETTDEGWRQLWQERTGEMYPWPKRQSRRASGADTLPETSYISSMRSFPESVSTCDTPAPERYSDAGNALRLSRIFGQDIIYSRQSDEYYVWNGQRWIRDLNNVQMLQRAKEVTEQMFREAEGEEEERANKLRRHALVSQSAARLAGMVGLAKLYVRNIDRGELDIDPWLLNCLNGTIDLRTGICREPRREDLITKQAPVRFDPTADCSLWKKCLNDWMLSDAEKVEYLKRLSGYTITGCTNEETMPILWGRGRNGKTKFYGTIYNILGEGEYAKAASFDSFVVKKGDEGMPNDVAGWCGMRLIVASEGEHSKRLAEGKLKHCIGRDPVVGEFKYQEEFSYLPTYKVWLVTNPKPRIVGTTEAIWDKLHFLAWNRYFKPEERDLNLQEKLNSEASGILNWLIEGCLEWQKTGLALPDSMKEDTLQYRHEQDVVQRFIDDECVVGEGLSAGKQSTYDQFKEWAEEAGEHFTMSRADFNEKMLEKFEDDRTNRGRIWMGFGLKRLQEQGTGAQEGASAIEGYLRKEDK